MAGGGILARKTEVLLPHSLFADLDKTSATPIYRQVASKFEEAIRQGVLPPGSRIENEISLAERLSLSRPTIRRAIQSLVDHGLVVRRRGIGTQVVHDKLTRGLALTSLYDDIVEKGATPSTKVVFFSESPASVSVAEALGIRPGTLVIEIIRVRGADGVPFAVLHNWVPLTVGPIVKADLERKGLYQLLEARGFFPRVGKQRVSALKAGAEQANLLDIDPGSALLAMERTAYDSMGLAIEHGEHFYRADTYSLEFTVVSK